jgi:hypothetical protein
MHLPAMFGLLQENAPTSSSLTPVGDRLALLRDNRAHLQRLVQRLVHRLQYLGNRGGGIFLG